MIIKTETTEIAGFMVAGISVRTTNKAGQAQTDIGELWGKFRAEGIMQQITDKMSEHIYSVYTGYETDYTGFYTCLLGCRVSSPDGLPERFCKVAIPAGKYRVYDLADRSPRSIAAAWQEIWNTEINRAYTADFDLCSHQPHEQGVQIYVAINGGR